MILAHRGMGKGRDENTMNSFRRGLGYGADGVEFDVRLTGDLEVVLNHDHNLKRTRNLDIVIGEHTWPELMRMGLTGDDGLTTLENVFETLPSDSYFDIEIKDPGKIKGLSETEKYEILVGKTLEIINRYHAVDRCMISSFVLECLSIVKKKEPALVTGALIEEGLAGERVKEFLLEVVKKYEPDYLNLDQRMFGTLGMETATKILKDVKKTGVKLALWTLNDPGLFEDTRDICDIAITDVSDVLVRIK